MSLNHVSIAIPTFNRAHLIAATIESALRQAHLDWDLVVVDDASSDGTPELVQKFCDKDSRIRLVVNEANLGLTRNWNKCLGLAKGPLVQLLLSDDLMDESYLGEVVLVFEKNPSTGFVASSCRYIDGEGNLLQEGAEIPARLFQAGDEAVDGLLNIGYPHVSGIVIRKACIDEVGGFLEKVWHGPDVELDARLAARYGFYHIGKVRTSFRRHGTNMGALEFLRRDFLEADTLKKRLALSYLSESGRERRGIRNLDEWAAREMAQTASSGATIAIGYGRARLSRCYLRSALCASWRAVLMKQFWKAVILNVAPPAGTAVMRRRMRIDPRDMELAMQVEESLRKVGA